LSDIALAGQVEFNSLIWITSLRDSELGTTRRVMEDLEHVLQSNEFRASLFVPDNRNHLLQFLDVIAEQARGPLRPIIHLDMHGDEERGLFIAATGEHLPWLDLLDKFRMINIGTDNNLCVVAPVCHAYHAILQIKLDQLTPFSLFIAPVHEVTSGFIEERIVPFYQEMFASQDIVKAYRQHLQAHLDLFSAHRIFVRILINYIVKHCMGQGLRARKEDLISAAINRGTPRNRSNLRKLRSELRTALVPTRALVAKYARPFLNRHHPGIDVDEIVKLARLQVNQARGKPNASPRL